LSLLVRTYFLRAAFVASVVGGPITAEL
jgi:hypothetical protein